MKSLGFRLINKTNGSIRYTRKTFTMFKYTRKSLIASMKNCNCKETIIHRKLKSLSWSSKNATMRRWYQQIHATVKRTSRTISVANLLSSCRMKSDFKYKTTVIRKLDHKLNLYGIQFHPRFVKILCTQSLLLSLSFKIHSLCK